MACGALEKEPGARCQVPGTSSHLISASFMASQVGRAKGTGRTEDQNLLVKRKEIVCRAKEEDKTVEDAGLPIADFFFSLFNLLV